MLAVRALIQGSKVTLQYLLSDDDNWITHSGRPPKDTWMANRCRTYQADWYQLNLEPKTFDASWNTGFAELLKAALKNRTNPLRLTVVTVSRAESIQ